MHKAITYLVLLTLTACNGQVAEPGLVTQANTMQPSGHGQQEAQKPRKRRQVLVTPDDHLKILRERPIPAIGAASSLKDEDFKSLLTDKEFHILRQNGTERAFSGEYNDHKEEGTYHCRACNAPLYTSATKFDSKTGWPSFYDAIEGRVATRPDLSHGMERTEIICAHCSSHLGHVFEDGPEPTGLRHCANSLSLVFHAKED